MPGWRDEADAEVIDRFAQHTANNEGRREYMDAYEFARRMIDAGETEEQIRRSIIREPDQSESDMHGQVGINARKTYAAAQARADIRKKGVEDALRGREPSYRS